METPWEQTGLPHMPFWVDVDHFMSAFTFAAKLVNEWTRDFGKDKAQEMVLSQDWQEPHSSAFASAFGVAD